MSNTILTPTAVTRRALEVLQNNLVFTKQINRQYDDQFANEGGKIGTSLKIRLPNQYTVRSGAAINVQDTAESSVTLTVATQKGVDVNFSSAELTMSIDDFSERILMPAMAELAANIDYTGMGMYSDVYQQVGSAGTAPNTALVYLQAAQKLNESAAPMDMRRVVINPAANAATVSALTGLFAPNAAISSQYEKGLMGKNALGFDFYMSQSVNVHTCGTRDNTTPIVNGSVTSGSSIVVSGADANVTFTVGDVFTVADCFAVNPRTKQSTGALQQFVVTAAATADGAGAVTLTVSPSIVTSGAYQNVTAAGAANGKALVFVGTASTGYAQNIAFHKDAFCLATADLIVPKGVDFAYRAVNEGMSLRVVRQYDINNDLFPCRIDILHGFKTIRPELACRITG